MGSFKYFLKSRIVKRILVINLYGLGDNLIMLPFLANIKKVFPDSVLDVLVPNGRQELFYNSNVDHIYYPEHSNEISNAKYDIVFYEDVSSKPNFFLIYYAKEKSFITNIKISKYNKSRNKVNYFIVMESFKNSNLLRIPRCFFIMGNTMYFQYNSLLTLFDKKFDKFFLFNSMPISVNNLIKANYFIERNTMSICICPGSPEKEKRWPILNYISLIKFLQLKYNARIILLGAKCDVKIGKRIKKAVTKNIVNLIGLTSIGFSSAIMKKSNLVITNEGGAMHLAAAVNSIILVLTHAKKVNKYLPLHQKNLYYCKGNDMENIKLDVVINKVKEIIDKNKKMKRLDIKTGFICNNNCIFCVQADNKYTGNRSNQAIKKDLIESRKRCEGVVFTGGEVTIRTDFLELVKFANDLGYRSIQIQSNGRMFSSLEFCKKTILAGATEFSPSLHGYCEKQHDLLVNASGSFNQVMKGIKNLKSLGCKVITNTVVVKQNYKDIPKIAKLLVQLGVNQFQFAFVHAMGNAWKNKESVVPKMSIVSPYIKKGLQIGIDAGKMVMVEAIPYCMMQGYENYIAEKFMPETEIRGKKIQNTNDFGFQRKVQGKTKFSQCKKCRYNSICEGVWHDYADIYGGKEFVPR
ncbi:MAG: radical SAM protein [Candidatus Woesearchaeota archaeon]